MSYNLFLDDVRWPHQVSWVALPLVEWKIVRSYQEFVNYVKANGLPKRVTFDHDLGPEHYTYDWSGTDLYPNQDTGYDCVKWLVQYCQDHNLAFPEYHLHTMNVVGLENMKSYIEAFKRSAQQKELAKKKN
jgi:hypothetical protein